MTAYEWLVIHHGPDPDPHTLERLLAKLENDFEDALWMRDLYRAGSV